MNEIPELLAKVQPFLQTYEAAHVDHIWQAQSSQFREFWNGRVMAHDSQAISDADCDQIIGMLDRNAKGNTKASHSVARAMIAQGAWRRMLNELHSNRPLGHAVDRVLNEEDPVRKAGAIDAVYELNSGQANYLTGQSGNAIGAFLAAWDPVRNLSMISLNDRGRVIEYLGLQIGFDWTSATIGTRMAMSNRPILDAATKIGLPSSARTVTSFFYSPPVKGLWKDEHDVKLPGHTVSVSVPTVPEEEEAFDMVSSSGADEEIRESMQIQALLAHIGAQMGFQIWLPRSDRTRVLRAWTPGPKELLDVLPLGYDPTTTATIEQIDVLWLNRRSIVRAFEVEHTTSIYSGLLRMADLVVLQPNINVRLHIVAGAERREKVLREIRRPVFSLLEGLVLRELCTYLSYDDVREIAQLKHLNYIRDGVIAQYEEWAGDNGAEQS